MKAKQITLHRGKQSWMATTTINGRPDPSLVDLFGSATLPTAWTTFANPVDVYNDLERLNPDADVRVETVDGVIVYR